ncbi:hypothetical protein R3W88_029850 [Solanum pinnatisectum]|uniref:Uncharacterized protein n=1 Tax=Solanum pinnatisectum TaxID=50273 RepID=A0AAV9K6I3_9SOLN|nr:hypothetical protein R3W88_029850 [Solanum pinnatisectum]
MASKFRSLESGRNILSYMDPIARTTYRQKFKSHFGGYVESINNPNNLSHANSNYGVDKRNDDNLVAPNPKSPSSSTGAAIGRKSPYAPTNPP